MGIIKMIDGWLYKFTRYIFNGYKPTKPEKEEFDNYYLIIKPKVLEE